MSIRLVYTHGGPHFIFCKQDTQADEEEYTACPLPPAPPPPGWCAWHTPWGGANACDAWPIASPAGLAKAHRINAARSPVRASARWLQLLFEAARSRPDLGSRIWGQIMRRVRTGCSVLAGKVWHLHTPFQQKVRAQSFPRGRERILPPTSDLSPGPDAERTLVPCAARLAAAEWVFPLGGAESTFHSADRHAPRAGADVPAALVPAAARLALAHRPRAGGNPKAVRHCALLHGPEQPASG